MNPILGKCKCRLIKLNASAYASITGQSNASAYAAFACALANANVFEHTPGVCDVFAKSDNNI